MGRNEEGRVIGGRGGREQEEEGRRREGGEGERGRECKGLGLGLVIGCKRE